MGWSGDTAAVLTHVALSTLWLDPVSIVRSLVQQVEHGCSWSLVMLSGPCLGEQVFIYISLRKH